MKCIGCCKTFVPPGSTLRLNGILYQIEAHKKLHRRVQLDQILSITLLKDLARYITM